MKQKNYELKLRSLLASMKARCKSNQKQTFQYYKAKGIKVFDEWANNPKSFVDWALDNGYSNGLQIDRIDSNGDYKPDNCRFVEIEINCRNQKTRKDNTSGCKGVNYDKRKNLWAVRISVNGERKYVGRFKKLEDAIQARKDAEKEYWSS